MELVVEEVDALKRKLNITIPEDVVSSRINAAYRELNKQIKMPGFRPGKIPQKILEKQVPVQSFTQMFQELLQDYYEKALLESGLTPVSAPEMDQNALKEIKKDSPINFSVTIHIKPEMNITSYKGMKFKKIEPKIGEKDIDAALVQILDSFSNFEGYDEDHPVQNGDYVVMDFEGSLRGEPLENGSAQGMEIRIGEGKMIPGFEDRLIGRKQNSEFEIKVPLPVDWNKKIRRVSIPIPGEKGDEELDIADFKVKIKELKKKVYPELTDEFVQEQEGAETVEEFRRNVKAQLLSYKEHQEEMRIKEKIFQKLVDENDVQPPESLVASEIKFMVEGMKFQIQQSGMTLEDSGFEQEVAEKEWRPKAEFNAKGYMILEEISKQEGCHVTESDMENEYQRLSEQTKKPVDEVKKLLVANSESFEQTKSKLMGQKALNLIYSHCEFEFVREEPKPDAEKSPADYNKKG